MATGTPGTNGVWQYGEDDSEATFSALLNKAASTTDTQIGLDRARLTTLEGNARIVQVIQAASITTATASTTSWTSSTLTATITPTSASNRIMVICHSGVGYDTRATTGFFTLFRGTVSGTNLGNGTNGMTALYPAASTTEWTNLALHYLDSPATTSATTYTLGMRCSATGIGTVSAQNNQSTGIMLLVEIKG